MTVTGDLAAFAAGVSIEELPADVVHALRRNLLDAVGCALASAGDGAGHAVVETVRAWAGSRDAGVIGLDFRAPAAQAAFATGTLIHALDYDDTHVPSVVHAGAAVVPAALAVAEEAGADGRIVASALAAGYEIAVRVGSAAGAALRGLGLDPTGVCGPYGAAAAAGRIWGLDRRQMQHALGIAGAMAGGMVGGPAGDSLVMQIRAGWAAQTGVVAADLARRGFTGPAAILDAPARKRGRDDLFPERARITDALDERWEMLRIALKPYPACHFVHAYADAIARVGVKPGDVEEIICMVSPNIVGVVCEPRVAKAHPETSTQARFSLPFAVATAMVGGRTPLEMFGEDARNDRRVLQLAERVTYEPDTTMGYPDVFDGKMIVRLRDGRTREASEPVNRGHPDRPLSDDDLQSKFATNARKRLDQAQTAKLAGEIWRLERLDSIDELLSLAQI